MEKPVKLIIGKDEPADHIPIHIWLEKYEDSSNSNTLKLVAKKSNEKEKTLCTLTSTPTGIGIKATLANRWSNYEASYSYNDTRELVVNILLD